MAGMSVGGLVSGMDTNSIVAQLTALEQMKVTRENQKKESAQKTLDKFKELQTRLGNLAAKASAIETQNKFNVFKSTSSYEDYVSVSGKEGATAGQYEIEVKQLATTQKVYSKKIDEINTPVIAAVGADPVDFFDTNGSATISLSKTEAALKKDPTKKTVDIKISKNDTLKDIVNKINAAEGAGVRASIMAMANGDNRLVLTAVETGTNGFQISDNSAAIGKGSILEALGILSSGTDQVVASKNVLLTTDGEIADESTKFDKLNTVMNKNNFATGDKIGIYLPTDNGSGTGGWVTFDLYNGTTAKTIGDVLGEINTALTASGANFTATLNEHGEIILKGDLNGDRNFDSSSLKDVKIQMGTFKSDNSGFLEVKKDMGGLTSRSIFANPLNEGKNAIYTIDGMTVNSQSNTDDKTINGTIFTLKKVSKEGMEPIKVSLELDKDAIVGNITAFIDEFNALLSFINENAKTTVKEDTDKISGKKTTTREVGPFSGDSGISSLRDNLKRMMTSVIEEISGTKNNGYQTTYSSASRLGITTQKDGTLGVDRDKLTQAINADFEGIRRLFTSNNFSDTVGCKVGNFNKNSSAGVYEVTVDVDGSAIVMLNGQKMNLMEYNGNEVLENRVITLENGLAFEVPTSFGAGGPETAKITFVRGIASQISNFVDKAKDTVSGYYKTSEKNYQNRIDSIQKRVEELQVRVDNYNARITKQFAALERNMGNLQSQTANMMSALSGVSYRR